MAELEAKWKIEIEPFKRIQFFRGNLTDLAAWRKEGVDHIHEGVLRDEVIGFIAKGCLTVFRQVIVGSDDDRGLRMLSFMIRVNASPFMSGSLMSMNTSSGDKGFHLLSASFPLVTSKISMEGSEIAGLCGGVP